MNNLVDSHKRTSISQLLNPLAVQDTSAFSPGQLPSLSNSVGQISDQQDVSSYHASFGHNAPYNLRAASWGKAPEDPNKRRLDTDGQSRPYPQQPHMNSTDVMYGDHQASRVIRARMGDPNGYGMNPPIWQQPQQHDISSMGYGPPVISPIYSDERTSLSGDYASQTHYSQGYQEQPPSGTVETPWQSTDRASVRIAARGTLHTHPSHGHQQHQQQQHQQEQQEQQQQMRYMAPYYPPPRTIYNSDSFQHQSQPPSQSYPRSEQTDSQGQVQIPHPQTSQKRSLSMDNDDATATAPKSKKSKGKSKSTSADTANGSKRGYNSRKRSEAAHIAAQNAAQLLPAAGFASKGKERATDEDGIEGSGPLQPELQFARCMSNRYKTEQFPRCVSCTRRWAGDTCRFQGIRFFLKDTQRNIVGISFVESQKADAPSMNFPAQWNIPLKPQHIRRTKRTVAQALLPTLLQEFEHVKIPEIIRRPRESEVRATCDTCMTSLFSSSWMCRLCGREACAECFEQVQELTVDRPGATQGEIASLQARREKHAHGNPFFLSCTRRNEHQAKDFSPMSRFCKTELEQAIKDMQEVLAQPDLDALESPGLVSTLNGATPHATNSNSSLSAALIIPSVPGNPSMANVISSPPNAEPPISTDEAIPFYIIQRFTDTALTDDVFRPIWARGDPLVVTDLLPKFEISWTPEYFMEKYDTQSCLIIECQTDTNKRVTVGEFFNGFGKYEGRKDCWKLKDWPPSTDFRSAFPELYEDFRHAVPVPNYVRRDGVLNIASHFPANTVSPDLGPKMYNAMASHQGAGSKGSTRLHMDMADALNIMTYAASTPDGNPGTAVWDIYRAGDSDKIRQFLKKRFKGSFQHDPIHSQQFYIDEVLRKELFDETGVKSYRIYQKPGEAVFIPAGCAHQVCNLADCVKVAIDFVSPENIARCEKLTKEFREQNQSMAWKEDVLQLRTMMWFAWLSCCRQEQ